MKLQNNNIINILENRFEKNMYRHKNLTWTKVLEKLQKNPDKLLSLNKMESTGGEPDVIDYNKKTDEYIFCDCSIETPGGRRNICYDRQALDARKIAKPKNNAMDMANQMGILILTEIQYKNLQKLGTFDTKTSSWIKTPDKIRKLGGALFADRRYDHIFIYHNGADSYYASRGFRGTVKV